MAEEDGATEEAISYLSSASTSDEEDGKVLKKKELEPEVPEVPLPKYTDKELDTLVNFVQRMTVLYALDHRDWTEQSLDVIRQWLLHVDELILTVFYDGIELKACLTFPLMPVYDLTYFMREPYQIFSVDDFHDQIIFGTLHEDIEGTLLHILEKVYVPIFFQYEDWTENVKARLQNSLNKFLCFLTGLHYKLGGMIVLFVPNTGNLLNKDDVTKDRELMKNLESVAISWANQIRLGLGDKTQLVPYELVTPFDDYEFWLYRYEVLQGLYVQLQSEDILKIAKVLRKAQSVYIKQIEELTDECRKEMDEAKSNIKYLQLVVNPCKELDQTDSPAGIVVRLPQIIHTFRYIWLNSKYFNTKESITSLFRALSNQIIMYCQKQVRVEYVLDGHPRYGIKMCDMSIDCCLGYKKIYEMISMEHKRANSEVGWELDFATIFNHVDSFIERLNDLMDICESMIVFGRMDETEKICKPLFGGQRGCEFEKTCEALEKQFIEGLNHIKSVSKDILLDVHSSQWYDDVVTYRHLVQSIEEALQRLIGNVFNSVVNLEEGIEALATISYFSYRRSLRNTYILKTKEIWKMFTDELEDVIKRITEFSKCQMSWFPVYSEQAFTMRINLDRITWLKDLLEKAEWLPKVSTSIIALQEYKNVCSDLEKNIHKCFADWMASLGGDLLGRLNRTLIVRSKKYQGLVECNIDRTLLSICEEAKNFEMLGFIVPGNVLQIYAKHRSIKLTYENVVTVCLDYNKIISALSGEERRLFKALIQSCDRKISPGIFKLTWGAELSEAYLADCVKHTADLQEIVNTYKRANINISKICEQICDTPISRFNASSVVTLKVFVDQMNSYTRSATNMKYKQYKLILDLIAAVYMGFEPHIENMTTEWIYYILKFENMIETSLLVSARNSLQIMYETIHGDGTLAPSPILILEIDIKDKKIIFEPVLSEIAATMARLLVSIIETLEIFPRIWKKLGLPLSSEQELKPFSAVIAEDSECLKFQELINKEVIHNENELKSYLQHWMTFKSVWELDKDKTMKKYEGDTPANVFDRSIEEFSGIANDVSVQETITTVHFVVINANRLKSTILTHIDDWQNRYVVLLRKKASERISDIYKYMKLNGDLVMSIPRSIGAMKKAIKFYEKLVDEVPIKQAEFPKTYDLFKVLDKYEVIVPPAIAEMKDNLEQEWQNYLKKLLEADEMLGNTKEDFKLKLLKQAEQFKQDVKSLAEEFALNVPTTSATPPKVALAYLAGVRKKIEHLLKTEVDLQENLRVFSINQPENYELRKLIKELEIWEEIWGLVAEWETAWIKFKQGNFWKIQIDEMEDTAFNLYRNLNRLCKQFKEKNWEILETSRKQVDDFRRTLPLVTALKNPSMRLRHWDRVRTVMNVEFDQNSKDFNLGAIIAMDFQAYSEDIQDISNAATMELQIENGIVAIQEIWKTMFFEIIYYKDGVFRIKNVDDCFQMLEEHATQISSMKSTRFVEPFAKEVDFWEKTLSYVSETLEQALVVQRQWLYLENIFSGEDIKKQLPHEHAKFTDISKQWRVITHKMFNAETALRAVHIRPAPFLLNKLFELDSKLEQIQRALEVYLETKRQLFPRFYFISNDDLLEILGNAKRPDLVQPHLKKLFDNLYKLQLKKVTVKGTMRWEAAGMYSEDEEYVEFLKPLHLNGAAEFWLNEVLTAMILVLKDKLRLTRTSLKKFLSERDKWIGKWPGQLCLTSSLIQWTTDCTRSLIHCKIIESKKPLKKLKKKQSKVLAKLSEMSRKDLNRQLRLKVNTLITVEIHGRDVIERMYKVNCRDVTHFEWFSQLRFYWSREIEICIIRQTNTEHTYLYEYTGNSGRLVITPLTDRCYITLTTALHLFRGGSPKGPAGTGKTETVKDLGKALGIWVIVTNCSEGLDYKSIGKNFSGLAQSGCWGCFDEFNRINIEVLSVVAQQILSILSALAQKLTKFMFEGQMINLKPTVGLFITMNPGYAGRTELPDNLKSMFRSIAMIVPDTAIIAENILFSDGFQNTKNLARKVYTLYELAKQQLSKQYHYDFGLRSMAALLRYAGIKRRQLQGVNEEEVVYLAMKDMNVARLTSNDLPLFNAIMADIFPGVSVPSIDYSDFKKSIKEELEAENLQVIHSAINKIIELYETKNSRHSVMIIGDTCTAKSITWKTLQGAHSRMKARGIAGWEGVAVYPVNPKSLNLAELYGEYNLSTGEWLDGVLSSIMRTICSDESPTLKWMLFDGPVDAVWIENMNSVMDDNKVLTLVNSERITMPRQVSLLFEVGDLAVASPATVSRCGMVYNDYKDWGWRPYVRSWLNLQKPKEYAALLHEAFDRYIDKLLDFKKEKCKETVTTNELNLIMSLCRLLECLGTKENGITAGNTEMLEVMTKLWFLFCLVWSVCATVNEQGRARIDAYIRELESIFPIKDTIYDYYVDPKQKTFIPWEDKLCDSWRYDNDAPFYKIIVPTVDTVRYNYLVSKLLDAKNPVMLVGDVGTGKSSTAISVTENVNKEKYTILSINISAQTTAAGLQESIENKTEKRTKEIFVPIGGKNMICFMDDFNMPTKDEYGSQPPLELVRQWIDYKFWYNRKNQQRIYVMQSLLMVAMGPPGGGRQVISPRTTSRFFMINMTFPSESTITRIYGTMLKQKMSDFVEEVRILYKSITSASIQLYQAVSRKMLPTPAKTHYLFNLRDISRVFQGLLRSSREYHATKTIVLRLWIHESARVFSDRLVDQSDLDWFKGQLNDTLGQFFETTFHNLCPSKDFPMFGDFIGSYYEDLTSINDLRKYMLIMLEDYNNAPGNARMDLVFFKDAIEHIIRIIRVISQPRGHMLNIGIGGSGRQILTKLASYISELSIFQIEVTKKYKTSEFREDLKNLYKQTGVKNRPTCFIFSGEQVAEETFLEIINNMLSTGEINLFKADEFEELKTSLEKAAKKNGIMLTTEAMYNFFMHTVRENLHIALYFSPIGEAFRRYLRQYPALINSTTTNWFLLWPQSALLEVAVKFLSNTKLYVALPGTEDEVHRDSLVRTTEDKLQESVAYAFSIIHTSVIQMSNTMLLEMKRHNYVTSINYLELVVGYQDMLAKKREEVLGISNKLRNGLSKIQDTQEKVAAMSEELKIIQEKVAKLLVECEVFLVEIQARTNETDEQRVSVEAKSKIIALEEVECKIMADQAQAELDVVMPALDAATKALDALSKKDISEVKSYGRPPVKVEKVMEAVMILLGQTPNWETSKKVLGEQNFLNDLRNFDKDHISDKTLKRIATYTTDTELEPDKVGIVSFACKSLMLWIRAIENYAKVWRIVAPKKAKLDEALASLRMKQLMLEEARRKLQELQEKLDQLKRDFEIKTQEQEELQEKANKLRIQLERAIILVESLAGEKDRWRETVAQLDIQFMNLPGDCLIATAFISYAGPFDTMYRENLQISWQKLITEKQIPGTDDLQIIKFLCDPVTIREWRIQGLPSDDFSTENGVIVTAGRRWPLIIDPQMQAHAWIRNLEKKDLKIIDFGEPDYLKTLEKSLQSGIPILLQNVSETLDPAITPILRKTFVIQAGQKLIKFNDKFITYNNSFKLYITTKLSNPHYPPEISSKTTLVNFAVKHSGLEAQLLAIIVRKEKPALEEQKDNLVLTIAKNRRILIDLDNEILRLLNETRGSLLEDDELFSTLQMSRKASVAVKESLSTAEVTEIEIDTARQAYQPSAERASTLFFVLMDMTKIDPMYQFSLNAYILLFIQSIEKSPKHPILTERIINVNDYHTYAVYKTTCRGLFEKHKLLFSTHMCSKILEMAGKLNTDEYDFLLKGGIVLDRQGQVPNPWPAWISENVWDNISELDKVPGFHGIVDSFEQQPRSWQEWYATTMPEVLPLVGDWKDVLNDFQKMLVVRCLRPDRMSFCMSTYIVNFLGQRFVEPPVLDLKAVFDESIAQTPLIFVLSPGVDPTSALLALAEQSKMSSKLDSLSLGQGQAPIATKLLLSGVKTGHWVFLANCHLSLSWMPKLDKIIETIQSGQIHKKFRLWLSSSPHPDFPISILQSSIKMTTEPPRGIKANMKRLYNTVNEDEFEECTDCPKYKKLLFALCFFHTVLLERKKFQQLGWNIVYSFNDSDFEVSDILLKLYLTEYEETPWGALKYLIAGVNYGGHVTDDWDRRLLTTYINQFFCDPALNTTQYRLSSLTTYYIPKDGSIQVYRDYIQLLPNFDKPEAFGQHPNADIASLITETRYMFETLLSMKVQTQSSSGETKETRVLQLAQDIESKIPDEIGYDATSKLIGPVKSPLDVVLLQEIERYNRLLNVIRIGLRDLQKGIKGLVVMGIELENVFSAVDEGKVPAAWLKTYSSLKPLGSWARNLVHRIEHFALWAKTLRPPTLFWLSAYTFPTGFLTAVLQTSARQTKTPIDELTWDFNVFSEDDAAVSRMTRESGVFIRGFFLEGAGWNRKGQCLQEPQPMELVSAMPVIHFKPVENLKKRTKGLYQCPCYYFPERSVSYVIAVDLKVGNESSDFWIKRGTAMLLSLST